MRRHICLVVAMLLIATSLSACGKDKNDEEIKKIEASNVAESKEQKEKKYEESKEPDEIPEKTDEIEDADSAEEEEVDTSGIMGYWSDDAGNSLQFYSETDEDGNETGNIAYSGFIAKDELYISGTAETDNQTYIKCKQTEFRSETVTDNSEINNEQNVTLEVIKQEITDPETGEVSEVELSIDPFAKEWVFDEKGKIIAWTDADGNEQPIAEEDRAMIDIYNEQIENPGSTDNESTEAFKDVEYQITRFEVDKDNNCTYMDITVNGEQLTFTRYN